MNENNNKSKQSSFLYFLDGKEPPQQMLEDWEALVDVFPSISDSIWDLLRLSLTDKDKYVDAVEGCVEKSEIESEKLRTAINLLQFIISQAAFNDLDADRLKTDLQKFKNASDEVIETILSGYDSHKHVFRQQCKQKALLEHCMTVTDMHWRADNIEATDRGRHLDTSIALITFTYVGRIGAERISLAFDGETLTYLYSMLEKIQKWTAPQGFRWVEEGADKNESK